MLLRLIIWALLGFLVYVIVKAAVQALHAQTAQPPEKSRGGETMERDPQCGTFVPRGEAVPASVRGQQHWFCSARCRDEFMKNH